MKPFTLKRFILLPLIILSLILTTGCHLLSHYSKDEVQQYINKDYPNLKKASYREKAAKALYDGVEKIFKKYPAK